MKFFEVMQSFLVYVEAERNYSEQSLAKLHDCIKAWILPMFGETEVDRLTAMHVLNFRQKMLERGLSAARQTSVLVALKVLLRFCREFLRMSCLNPAEISLPPKRPPTPIVLTNYEVQKIVDAPNVRTFPGVRLRALIELLLATGLRIGEAIALEREPFDQGTTEIDIIGKGRKRRTIFFNDRCRFWIKQYLSRRFDDCPALFVTTGGYPRQWSKNDVSYFFRRLGSAVGLNKPFTPHILRHTFCTNLRNNGVDISLIKELAGHADIQTTARYYLGVDKPTLRRVVRECLDYERPASEHVA